MTTALRSTSWAVPLSDVDDYAVDVRADYFAEFTKMMAEFVLHDLDSERVELLEVLMKILNTNYYADDQSHYSQNIYADSDVCFLVPMPLQAFLPSIDPGHLTINLSPPCSHSTQRSWQVVEVV